MPSSGSQVWLRGSQCPPAIVAARVYWNRPVLLALGWPYCAAHVCDSVIGVDLAIAVLIVGAIDDRAACIASRLEQQLDAITRLPKAKLKMVSELIDSVIVKTEMEAQHAA